MTGMLWIRSRRLGICVLLTPWSAILTSLNILIVCSFFCNAFWWFKLLFTLMVIVFYSPQPNTLCCDLFICLILLFGNSLSDFTILQKVLSITICYPDFYFIFCLLICFELFPLLMSSRNAVPVIGTPAVGGVHKMLSTT